MSDNFNSEGFSELHRELGKDLLNRIKEKTATAADLNVARQFLKDNQVKSGNSRKNRVLQELTEALPFSDVEEDDGSA
jgi:hypothetical protein